MPDDVSGTRKLSGRFHDKDCALRRYETATKCSCGVYKRRNERGVWRESLCRGQKTRWTGHLRIPRTAHPLVKNLFMIMNREGIGINQINSVAGFSKRTLSEIRYSQSPSIATVVAAYNAIGRDLEVVDRVAQPEQNLMAKILNALRLHQGSWVDHPRLRQEIYLHDAHGLSVQIFRAACRGLIRLGFPIFMKGTRDGTVYRFEPRVSNATRIYDLIDDRPAVEQLAAALAEGE